MEVKMQTWSNTNLALLCFATTSDLHSPLSCGDKILYHGVEWAIVGASDGMVRQWIKQQDASLWVEVLGKTQNIFAINPLLLKVAKLNDVQFD